MDIESFIKQKGLEIGFDHVSIAEAKSYKEHEALQGWLNQGFHASMHYMERSADKRQDPKKVMPEAESVIVCALNYNTDYPYSTECRDSTKGWIARYAWGEDYHEVIGEMLLRLQEASSQKVPGSNCKSYIDTGPTMDRVFAKHSGVGWVGKNSCMIHPKLGSWIFLGTLLTNLKLKSDSLVNDHCGKCMACIDACPTQAITEPHVIDARRCISYLTIEHRGEIEPELTEKMGNHILGCDICQDVCPWNRKAPKTNNHAFQPRGGFFNPDLEHFEIVVQNEYPQKFKHSPLKRAKKDGLLRNIFIAKNNQKI